MIDYNKLKIAHELTSKLSGMYVEMLLGIDDEPSLKLFDEDNKLLLLSTWNIDDLITKLRELTEPEPKIKLGWYVDSMDKICSVECDATKDGYALLGIHDGRAWGKTLYPTKTSLIEAQVKYWVDALKELPEFKRLTGHDKEPEYCAVSGAKLGNREECEHETDRMGYEVRTPYGEEVTQYKCIKCGEFHSG